mgnify:CR=1 FL=1
MLLCETHGKRGEESDTTSKKSSESAVYRASKNILKIANEGAKLCAGSK